MSSETTSISGTELVAISAADNEALADELKRVIAFLDRVRDVSLSDIAYTCSLMKGPARIATIASNVQELRSRLASALDRMQSGAQKIRDKSGTYWFKDRILEVNAEEGKGEGKALGRLAFIYPGVISFYPDMLRDITVLYKECRDAFDELEEAMKDNCDFTPSNFIFPPAPYYRHDADIFKSGAYAQALVSVYSANAALSRLISKCGLEPDGVVGCAGGDLAAIMKAGTAGSPNRQTRVGALREIYKIVDTAISHGGLPETAMLSLLMRREGEADDVVAAMPKDKISLSIEFSPRRRVYAIEPDYLDEAMKRFSDAGIRVLRMSLDRPFNTPKCAQIVTPIRKFTSNWMKAEPKIDVYSCGEATLIPKKVRHAKNETAERWAKPILFSKTIEKMYEDGYRVFLEVGPRGIMTSAVEDILKGKDAYAIALNSLHRRDTLQLQHGLAQLLALGAQMDISYLFNARAKKIDFSSTISLEVRSDSELRLTRTFPRMTLLGEEQNLSGARYLAEPKGRGAKAAERKAALNKEASRNRQFDSGAIQPLISDAEELESSPGISCEISKVFNIAQEPFIADFAIGSNQISYSDPNLKGFLFLGISVGAEIMAETAMRVMPRRNLAAIEDFVCRRRIAFTDGRLRLFIRAERIASPEPGSAALKVKIRDDSPNSAYTWPVMEATVFLTQNVPPPVPFIPSPLTRPRSVHWSGREIYPAMLSCGQRLRGITFAETWGEEGLDYTVKAPVHSGALTAISYPLWAIDPMLLETIASGFQLWRSQERFPGAFALPFRMRRLEVLGALPKEGSDLNCYMRLSGVTPQSQLCDITVTGGDGNVLISISGWEEETERIPKDYCQLILQPANAYLTETLSADIMGNPATDVSTAFTTGIPYPLFERHEALWLKIMSHVVLSDSERRTIAQMKGSIARRTEWLVGRLAAKEAVRRFLRDYYHARWSDADIQICPNPDGKPIAIGDWRRFLRTKLDIAIAHTAQFVVAIAAANAKVGVDVESVARDLSEEFASGVFTQDELELAAQSSNSSQALIRFWCAKEAVSKALGTGIRYSPKELIIADYQSDTGRIVARLEGGWVEAFKNFKGRDITVASKLMRDHALAFCFIPASLLDDGNDF